jgi:inner membrane protein YhjD
MRPTASSLIERADVIQRSKPVLAVPVAVYRKFGDERAGRLAAVIAYYGFFSVFPAMLALVTVLGFVLDNREDLRDDIQQGALGQLPVIGDYIGDAASRPLEGNTVALVLGLVTALWAGMGAMQASQDAVNTVFDVPRDDQPTFVKKRVRSLLMLVVLSALLVGGAALTQLVTVIGGISFAARVLLFAGTLALNVGVFWMAYQVLIAERQPWRSMLPGAITAGIGYHLLQVVGQLYVNHVLKGAQDTYGTFATVIGLLSWLHLMAQITLLGAVVNVVTSKQLWPRHLTRGLESPENQRTR